MIHGDKKKRNSVNSRKIQLEIMTSANRLQFHTKLLVLQILTSYQNCTHQTKNVGKEPLFSSSLKLSQFNVFGEQQLQVLSSKEILDQRKIHPAGNHLERKVESKFIKRSWPRKVVLQTGLEKLAQKCRVTDRLLTKLRCSHAFWEQLYLCNRQRGKEIRDSVHRPKQKDGVTKTVNGVTVRMCS